MRSPNQQASALVVLLQDLHKPSVCQDAPVHHQQQLSMEIDKALVHSMHLLWCFRCCSIILQAAQTDDIVLFLVQKETAQQVEHTMRTKTPSVSHPNSEAAVEV